MKNIRQIKNELETVASLKVAVDSYQEIAASRMRKVKKSVLANREFMTGLADLYQRVAVTHDYLNLEDANRSLLVSRKRRSANNTNLRKTNGKTVSVFVSSNTGLYGDIIKKTFDLFLKSVRTSSTDLVVIGRTGRQLCEKYLRGRDFKFFEGNDAVVETETIKNILLYLLPYTNITIYHGMYVSVLLQEPHTTFITGETLKLIENKDAKKLKCLIEPSVTEVMAFFEQQISSALFEQTMYESSLSKFASRMISLDFAGFNIKRRIMAIKFNEIKTRHEFADISQLERLAGISLWK